MKKEAILIFVRQEAANVFNWIIPQQSVLKLAAISISVCQLINESTYCFSSTSIPLKSDFFWN